MLSPVCRRLLGVLSAIVFSFILSHSAFASAVQVTNTTKCKTLPTYSTITEAVNAVPAGSTVYICPGTYPEQVSITEPMNLIGVSANNMGEVRITAPAGGIVASTPPVTDWYTNVPVAAQILVFNAFGTVNITNVTVDGSNSQITSCTPELVGIFYMNSNGKVANTNVLNENTPSANGCQTGQGIYVQSGTPNTSTVTISGNHVENYQKNGIVARQKGAYVTISDNTVIGQGVTPPGSAAENSIEIAFGATGTVTGNTVTADETATPSGAAGILVFNSGFVGVTISHNTVSNTQTGIAVNYENPGDSDGATITYNTVSGTHDYDGIDVCSSSNTITNNIVNGSDQSGIHLDSTCGSTPSTSNTVSNNTINGACAGILVGNNSAYSGTGDKFYNDITLVLTGQDTCSTAFTGQAASAGQAVVAGQKGAHRTVSP